ncbi:MAG: hypothetical protein IKH54_05120 [Bacilli bacterium]|nr:hypothetical protein [Bacilli bacterium]
MKKKKINTRRFTIKLLLCMVYMIIITILLVGSYTLFLQKKVIVPWNEVKSTEEYSYIEISKMSEKFAYYENENIGLHFVIEEEETGQWHTYVIAINEDTYKEYKDIIDYSYERTDKIPDKKQVFGYPTIMNSELKEMILHNINNFLPAENEVEITMDNMESYLTNSYLDTTKKHKEYFDVLLFITLLLLFIMIALLIFTIFDRDKIVDNLDDKARKVKVKKKQKKNRS